MSERKAPRPYFIRDQTPRYDQSFWILSQNIPVRRFCQMLVRPAGMSALTDTSPRHRAPSSNSPAHHGYRGRHRVDRHSHVSLELLRGARARARLFGSNCRVHVWAHAPV